MILIGFSGPAGSGKDTAAQALVRHAGFETMAFADTLKLGISEMFHFDYSLFESRETKEKKVPGLNHSPRELAQIIGTECARKMIGENTWIHIMARRYQEFCEREHTRLAITDVRFENEADWIRHSGGVVVHLVRHGVPWKKDGHESERGIEMHYEDCLIKNMDGVEELESKTLTLLKIIAEYGGKPPAGHPAKNL